MCNYQFSTPRGITKPAYRTPNKQHDAAGLIRLASPPLYIAITQSPPAGHGLRNYNSYKDHAGD